MTTLPSFVFGEGARGAPYLTFGLPADPAAWLSLALALGAVALSRSSRLRARLDETAAWLVLSSLAAMSAALSFGYLVHYLRGGPRIIDATSYFLEGRAFAAGKLWFDVPEPLASFDGRFLLSSQQGLAVLFPPGFPLVLALGFTFGAPLAVGPLLAALLVPATFAVARGLGASRSTAYAAAALGTASAALRYHTADTMSHGLAALLVATAFASSLRPSRPAAALAGAASGLLVATRPVTGVALLVLSAFGVRRRAGGFLAYTFGALPFLLFFVWHQHTLTGEWLRSGQAAYYAVADGPPGCFRFGFGSGIGCWYEHGDFVRARLPDGYGAVEAIANTLRRLAVHSSDVANFAPLAGFALAGAWLVRRTRGGRLASLVIAGVISGYAPFYFEGSYPGGGARFFADVLPLEHALIAVAAARLGCVWSLWPLTLFGFAVHTSHQHGALARREGGRPMYEPSVLASQKIMNGLVFVTTDHGFSLGHDPGVHDARSGIVVARARGDAHDRLLWENLGRPSAYLYRYDPSAPDSTPSIIPFVPPETQRLEAESLYPPESVAGGFVHPEVRRLPCVSAHRVLRFRPTGATGASATVRVTLTLPAPAAALSLGWSDDVGAEAQLHARANGRPAAIEWVTPPGQPCREGRVYLPPGRTLELEADGGALDYLEPLVAGRAPPP